MTDVPSVEDDDFVLRHIPPGTLWQALGPRVTSANFRIRADRAETAISVSRRSMTRPDNLLARVGGDPTSGSRVAFASVRAIRGMGLEVVPDPLPDDPGQAEIRSHSASLDVLATRQRLAALFEFLAAPA